MRKLTHSVAGTTTFATLASIPWCCVVPAVLSVASLSGAMVARLWLAKLAWLLLPLSFVLMGRALWLTQVRRQGRPWARWTTWASVVLMIALWAPRAWAWLT